MKNDLSDLQAMVAFARAGMNMFAARMVSVLALMGTFGLGGYVVFSPSWQGAVIFAVAAWCIVQPALKAESPHREPAKE